MAAVLAALLLALLERVPALRFRAAPLLRAHWRTDVVYLLTGYVAGGALTAWCLAAVMRPAPDFWAAVPAWAQVLLALVAIDLGNFAAHWLLHRVDALWVFHQAHHSSRQLDWLATFRSHAVEQLLRRVLAPLLLVLAGTPLPAVGTAAAIFLAWAVLNHANVRLPLGWLEGLFITPRLHRAHHVPATTERNLGTVLACWDRLLGTWVAADLAPDTPFGLPVDRDGYPQDWAGQLVAPWRRPAPPVRRRLPAA
jgi:sterol desaturase/sphingolipid hydroxylase (fatty acid hydroxylase superfamily)